MFIYMITNMICQLQDRGSHQEPAYHDHQVGSEVAFPTWPPHQGYGPKGILNKQNLEQGVSSRADLPTIHTFLVNGIMALWLPSQHNGLRFDKILFIHIQDHGSTGEINNSAKVMNTCRQQSSVNGIEVIMATPIGMILIPLCLLYPINNSYFMSQ